MSYGRAVAVVGPTASGKSALGVALAQRLNGEIVSADSMQIYRGMDIGTAKITPDEARGIPHHMLSVADPTEDYSVARFVEEATACCRDIIARGRLPVIVGGTGLYVDSLISGRSFSDMAGDDSLRLSLGEEYDRVGGEAMLEKLRLVDPERALKLSASDRRRIIRALEIYGLTGKTITEHDRESAAMPPAFDCAFIRLGFEDRSVLYERINSRVDAMIEAGLFGEVSSLLAAGVPADSTAMQAIGYKEAARCLKGELSREEAAELIKLNSRRYAKRQITWFSRRAEALSISFSRKPDMSAALEEALAYIGQVFQED